MFNGSILCFIFADNVRQYELVNVVQRITYNIIKKVKKWKKIEKNAVCAKTKHNIIHTSKEESPHSYKLSEFRIWILYGDYVDEKTPQTDYVTKQYPDMKL